MENAVKGVGAAGGRGQPLGLRRAAREVFEAQVRLCLPDRPPVTFLSRDLSPGGIFLRSQRPLPEGTRVGLSFQLPARGRFSCLAEVAWRTGPTHALDGRSGMGLRFRPLAPEELSPLTRYLERERGRHGVLILEDAVALREALAASFWTRGLSATTACWDEAPGALATPHALLVLGVDRAGLSAMIPARMPGAQRIALLGYDGGGVEWHPRASFCLNKPVDLEQVVRLSLALVR